MSSDALTLRERRRAALTALNKHRRVLSTSLLNQALSSVTNFGLSFVLVRVLSPPEFGVFGLGLSVCYLFGGVGNALFLTQMVVHIPEKEPHDRLPYAARMFFLVVVFGLATCAVTALTVYLGAHVSNAIRENELLALVVALASVAYLVKDFFIRLSYTARMEARAVAVTSSILVGLAALLVLARVVGIALTSERALLAFGLAQLTGAVTGVFQSKLPIRSVDWRRARADLIESWRHGSWAIAGVSITWAQSQAYSWVTVAMVGTAGVARANAARLFVAPFLLLIPAMNQVTMPRLAEMRAAANPSRMIRTGRLATSIMLGLAVLYGAVLVMGSTTVVPIVLGNKYTAMSGLVTAWCVVLTMAVMRDGAGTLLQAMKRFRSITVTNALSASVALAASIGLMKILGIPGAVLGTALGEGLLAIMLWRIVRNGQSAIG